MGKACVSLIALALVPAEERPALYGAAHNYREAWVEVWIARPDAGSKPCGGHVLLFFQSKTGQWQQIKEGLEWGDCPPDA